MEKIYLPDYKGGSIVNLMSSIGNVLGAKMPYPELRIMHSHELKNAKNIVLLVIDGLGYEYLSRKHDSFLRQNIRGRITTVFPPTTAAGITTFLTGLPVQQNAMTGWYMFFKEIGMVTKSLPFVPKIGGKSISERGYYMKDLIGAKAFTSRINANAFIINPAEVNDSSYSIACSENAKRIGYKSLNDYFNKIIKTLRLKSHKRKYIYAYWPRIDSYSHEFGVGSKKHENHFKELDKKMKEFIQRIQDTDTIVIITADHGLVNAPEHKAVWLNDHPKLKDCFILPIAGDARIAYCYIKPSKTREFEGYVRKYLQNCCWMFKSEELIKRNFYGLGQPNKKLLDRVGDYILLMKEGCMIRDWLEEKKDQNIGHHGGVSKEEMFVPLIVFKC